MFAHLRGDVRDLAEERGQREVAHRVGVLKRRHFRPR